ncbi:type II toxin-antitoxin system VapC family toxin [uncultured Pedobacter sp.]|mgnify:CR=1 FL=1|uniref:type II toxin-antitoxin system VapC family toxin n=1 Tax=uncultured Pedobacter sp. TaxID=246139 RepID=UPI00260A066C|nr:type II toxin-antitoxin system VapC family toxin [uncultured Pedobacter sp.]
MTGNNYCLDTNIVIEVFSGNMDIANKVNQLGDFYIPTIVLGELYIGINRVINKTKHLKKLNDFLTLCSLIDVDGNTSQHYGEITANLFKKGKPIPSNDIWIAAIAKQHNLILVTRDKHFNEIEGLSMESW